VVAAFSRHSRSSTW